jgi:hypothetical protein
MLYGPGRPFTAQISSTPSAATVVVDGVSKDQPTPLTVALDAHKPHTLVVALPGMQTWSKTLSGEPGSTQQVQAVLVAVAAPPELSAQPDAGVVVAPTPPPPSLEVSALHDALLVPKTKAARIQLNPARTYRVSVEGKSRPVIYLLAGGTAKETFGVLSAKPVTLHGTMLYAFFVDRDATPVTVRLRDTRGGNDTLTLGPDSIIELPVDQRAGTDGLDPNVEYELSVHAGTVHLHKTATTSRMLAFTGGDETVRVLEAGKKYRVLGSSFLWLTFPDDDAADNDGLISVEVRPRPKN